MSFLFHQSDLPQALGKFEYSQPQMGTTARLVFYAPSAADAERGATEAFARIAALDALLSDYRPDSELSRLTRRVGHPVKVSDDLFAMIDAAQGLAHRTDGAFDITVGPLSRLWRRARRQIELPSDAELEAAQRATGYRLLSLDRAARTATVARDGMQLDAGGIAKGYAADQALARLQRSGLGRALVAIGGDIALGDPPPGATGWQVGLAGLDATTVAPSSPLTLANAGVSTSGDAEQWVAIQGRRYSHIVDPRTGLGLTQRRTVSVVAPDAMTSDMLATALSVMDLDGGLALADAMPGTAAQVGIAAEGATSWRRSRNWPGPRRN